MLLILTSSALPTSSTWISPTTPTHYTTTVVSTRVKAPSKIYSTEGFNNDDEEEDGDGNQDASDACVIQ